MKKARLYGTRISVNASDIYLTPMYLTPAVRDALGDSSSSKGLHFYGILIYCTSSVLCRGKPSQVETCLGNFGHCQTCRRAGQQGWQSQASNLASIAFPSLQAVLCTSHPVFCHRSKELRDTRLGIHLRSESPFPEVQQHFIRSCQGSAAFVSMQRDCVERYTRE